jgi:hypothetical protein
MAGPQFTNMHALRPVEGGLNDSRSLQLSDVGVVTCIETENLLHSPDKGQRNLRMEHEGGILPPASIDVVLG